MHNHSKIIILLLVYSLLFCNSPIVLSATYYIDYVNGKDSNEGTAKSTPWKRCPGMAGFDGKYNHTNGDVFVFKGGVTWPYVSGSAILTIQNSGDVESEDRYTSDKSWYAGTSWDYPVFDGRNPSVTINGIQTYTIRSPQSNLVIEHIKIIRIGETKSGSGAGISSVYGGSNLHIRYNYLSPNCVNAFQYSPSRGIFKDIYFHHNTIRQTGRVYFVLGDGRVSNVNFYNNIMEGGWDYSPSGSYHIDGFFFGGDGVDDYAIHKLNIYNNHWWGDWQKGATAFIYISGTSDGSKKGCKDILICNNIIAPSNLSGKGGPTGNGIIVKWGHYNVSIYNNTIDYRSIINKGSYGILYYAYVTNVTIRNNIIAGFTNGIGFNNIRGTNVIDNNVFYGNNHLLWDQTTSNRYDTCVKAQVAGWMTSYCLNSDPKFITNITPADHDNSGYGIINGNLILQSNSPAINHGADLSIIFHN